MRRGGKEPEERMKGAGGEEERKRGGEDLKEKRKGGGGEEERS